jgi:hypothetical protein
MTRPIEVWTGSDVDIDIETDSDVSAATEIEWWMEGGRAVVKKSMGEGHITGLTSTQFTLTLLAADTESEQPGPYKMQCRATVGGLFRQIVFKPNQFILRDSLFSTSRNIRDYGG